MKHRVAVIVTPQLLERHGRPNDLSQHHKAIFFFGGLVLDNVRSSVSLIKYPFCLDCHF